ncbi:helix-turn-helix domain-containing protein [Candidatus Woesearchaeota archaeon]|nr:helix-turn-helix domain-containing protein [Candidatus Woesearchaeota archaeon]
MNKELVLQELGLSEGEIKTYLSLLKRGFSTVAKIKEDSGLHRTTVYDFLEKLMQKGLVSYVVQGGVNYYKASPPERLKQLLKEKEDKLKTIMPELESLAKLPKDEIKVEVYKGKQGFNTVLNKIIAVRKDMYGFGFEEEKYEQMDKIMMEQYFRKCNENNIKENVFVKRSTSFLYKHPHIRYHFLPDDYFNPNPSMTFGNYVAIQVWEPLTTILIENKALADSYKKYFNFLKDQSSMIFRGWNEVKKIFDESLELMKAGDEILTYGTSQDADNYVDYFREHNIIGIKKNIKARIMIDQRAKKNIAMCKATGWQVCSLKPGQGTAMEVDIYGKCAFMVIWKKDPRQVTAILFNDPEIVKSLKQYGEMLWKSAKPM